MASRKERQRILSSGLNLLPPSDKIEDGQALLLDNWRVDQEGCLRSRRGMQALGGPVGSGYFHTIARAGLDRYAGIGTELRYANDMSTVVASGLSGDPLGVAFYQHAAWVMNPAKQLRAKASLAYRWGIDAPATGPTLRQINSDLVAIDSFEGTGDAYLTAALDVGYLDDNGSFVAFPVQVNNVTTAGVVQTVNGSAALVGIGTVWDSTLVGKKISIQGYTLNAGFPVPYSFTSTVSSVVGANLLVMNDLYLGSSLVGLPYQIFSTSQMVTYDSVNHADGISSLKVNAQQAGVWVVNANTGPINSTVGTPSDDDAFHISIFCSDPQAIDDVVVTLYSGGAATYPTAALPQFPDPTQIVQIQIDRSSLNQTPGSWTELVILRTVDEDSWTKKINDASSAVDSTGASIADPVQIADIQTQFTLKLEQPHFTRVSNGAVLTNMSAQGTLARRRPGAPQAGHPIYSGIQPTAINWAALTGLQVKFNLADVCTFNVDRAFWADIPESGLKGSGEYFVSFANADNEDGNPGPSSLAITLDTGTVQLSNIPVSPDPQVTQRWIWRIGFGSTQALKVGEINDNFSTGPWNDETSVDEAQNIGVTMPTNRTLPPPAYGVIGPYFGKLIGFRSDSHPARYWWTPAAQPWFFPGADEDLGNWEDAGGDDDPFLQATNHANVLLIYKQRSLWRLIGDPESADPQMIDNSVGIVGVRAVANGGQRDYFMAQEGLYYRTADSKAKISHAIDPIFKGDYAPVSNGEYIPPISRAWIGLSVVELINDRLYVSYVEDGQSVPTVTVICQLPAEEAGDVYRWSRMKYSTSVNGDGGSFTALHYDGQPYALIGGCSTPSGGRLYALETGAQDGTQPIHLAWQSRFSDQGLPDNFKRYADVEVDFQTQVGGETPSTLSVYVVYDGFTKVLLGTISGIGRQTSTFSLKNIQTTNQDLKAKNCAIRVEGDATSTCVVYGTYLHWYPEERQALTFDSGFTDLGAPERVKQVDYLEMYATGSGQSLARVLSSDLPGSSLQARVTDAVTLPNGRGDVRTRLSSIVEGRDFRVLLSAGSVFQLHNLRARARVIGEYIDGSIGEFYQSPEFSVAPGRVGELKDFLLDYDTSGPGAQVVILSDLPGNALSVVRTITLPHFTTRAPFIVPLEDGSDILPYGQLFQVRILPPPGGILRLHGRAVFRARIIGVYFDGTRGEIWETQPLDLFGGIAQFREVAIVAATGGPMLFEMQAELPNEDMRTVASFTADTSASARRLPVYSRLPGTVKGQLQKFRLSGPYITRLYELRVFGRGLGTTETDWAWRDIPFERTPDGWTQIQMPVRSTPEEFSWVEIPVDVIG